MAKMCLCCGKLPKVASELLSVLPKSVLRAMPQLREGLCEACGYAGCDGGAPCKVFPELLDFKLKLPAIEAGWKLMRELERRWLNNEFASTLGTPASSNLDAWTQITSNYWLRLVNVSASRFACDILYVAAIPSYLAQVKVIASINR